MCEHKVHGSLLRLNIPKQAKLPMIVSADWVSVRSAVQRSQIHGDPTLELKGFGGLTANVLVPNTIAKGF